MRILEDLYFGRISPWERLCPKSEEYKEIGGKISKVREYFEKTLSAEGNEQFEKLQDLLCDSGEIEDICLFEYAFSPGALMMLDVFNFHEREQQRDKRE